MMSREIVDMRFFSSWSGGKDSCLAYWRAIKAVLPLWKAERQDLLRQFVDSGFEAIVVCVKSDVLSSDFLGRKVNGDLVEDLRKIPGVDVSGERGEYHTLAIDGPCFNQRLQVESVGIEAREGYQFLLMQPGRIG